MSILLNAINDPDLDVQIRIVCSVRDILAFSTSRYTPSNITPQLLDRAILETDPIVRKYINHPNLGIRDRVIHQLSPREADEWQSVDCIDDEASDLPALLKLLDNPDIEVRKSAVTSIVELGSAAVFPNVLEIANNPELGSGGEIFNEFHCDREVTIDENITRSILIISRSSNAKLTYYLLLITYYLFNNAQAKNRSV